MNVLSLFDGMSCGQIALKQLGIIPGKYYASEIDKHAIKQTQLNFPDTIQLGDVTQVDVSKLEPIDLLIGGSPCFAAGVKVLTDVGYKDIEDIRVGDKVLTHNNRYMPVLAIGHKEAMTYTLKAQGFVDVVCTKNHPFYARKKYKEYYRKDDGKKSARVILGDAEWVNAGLLKGDYYICSNIQNDLSENPYNITKDEAYVIGRYIADGHTRKDKRYDEYHKGSRAWQLILSIGNSKVEQFCSNIDKLNYSCYKHGDSVHRIVFSNKRLVELVEKYCGIGSINKHFGEAIVRLPKDLLSIVLKGFLDGDGCIDGNEWHITTISPMLAITIQRVVSKLYNSHINVGKHTPAEHKKLLGRTVRQNKQYIISFSEKERRYDKAKTIGDKMWSNVKSFTAYKMQTVYNLEVEEDNSYTANNFVVHNCQSFSFAGKRVGMSTVDKEEIYTLDRYLELKEEGFQFEGESYLFWEYMRILTDIRKYNPNVLFLLENVEMGKKWERVLSNAIGIYGVHINSALVSAQNRRRIYWTNIRTKRDGLFDDLYSDIPQPADKGFLLKDILEDEVDEKYYMSNKAISGIMNHKQRHTEKGNGFGAQFPTLKSNTLLARCYKDGKENLIVEDVRVKGVSYTDRGIRPHRGDHRKSGVSEYGTILYTDQKSNTHIASHVGMIVEGENPLNKGRKARGIIRLNPSKDSGGVQPYQQDRIYDVNGIAPALCVGHGGWGCNVNTDRIRRLTPTECARLQTIPSWYKWECSDTQQYRMLGNGWTVDVIVHILSFTKEKMNINVV